MKETIDTLQTLVLLMTLLLQIVVLLGVVYSFRFLLSAIREIVTVSSAPPSRPAANGVSYPEHDFSPPKATAHEKPVPFVKEEPKAPLALPRFKCHKCTARLPENPINSRIDGETTLLIYKCGRCGKETEVNPAVTPPVTEGK